jgi:hypothetical protein
MKTKGTLFIIAGLACLAATVVILPTPAFEVLSAKAGPGTAALFAVGTTFLLAALGLTSTGLRRRSRDLRTARSYDTQEPASRDGDRPVNPYELPKSYGAVPPLH